MEITNEDDNTKILADILTKYSDQFIKEQIFVARYNGNDNAYISPDTIIITEKTNNNIGYRTVHTTLQKFITAEYYNSNVDDIINSFQSKYPEFNNVPKKEIEFSVVVLLAELFGRMDEFATLSRLIDVYLEGLTNLRKVLMDKISSIRGKQAEQKAQPEEFIITDTISIKEIIFTYEPKVRIEKLEELFKQFELQDEYFNAVIYITTRKVEPEIKIHRNINTELLKKYIKQLPQNPVVQFVKGYRVGSNTLYATLSFYPTGSIVIRGISNVQEFDKIYKYTLEQVDKLQKIFPVDYFKNLLSGEFSSTNYIYQFTTKTQKEFDNIIMLKTIFEQDEIFKTIIKVTKVSPLERRITISYKDLYQITFTYRPTFAAYHIQLITKDTSLDFIQVLNEMLSYVKKNISAYSVFQLFDIAKIPEEELKNLETKLALKTILDTRNCQHGRYPIISNEQVRDQFYIKNDDKWVYCPKASDYPNIGITKQNSLCCFKKVRIQTSSFLDKFGDDPAELYNNAIKYNDAIGRVFKYNDNIFFVNNDTIENIGPNRGIKDIPENYTTKTLREIITTFSKVQWEPLDTIGGPINPNYTYIKSNFRAKLLPHTFGKLPSKFSQYLKLSPEYRRFGLPTEYTFVQQLQYIFMTKLTPRDLVDGLTEPQYLKLQRGSISFLFPNRRDITEEYLLEPSFLIELFQYSFKTNIYIFNSTDYNLTCFKNTSTYLGSNNNVFLISYPDETYDIIVMAQSQELSLRQQIYIFESNSTISKDIDTLYNLTCIYTENVLGLYLNTKDIFKEIISKGHSIKLQVLNVHNRVCYYQLENKALIPTIPSNIIERIPIARSLKDVELPDFDTQYNINFSWLYPQGVVAKKAILYNKIFLVPCVPLPKDFDFNTIAIPKITDNFIIDIDSYVLKDQNESNNTNKEEERYYLKKMVQWNLVRERLTPEIQKDIIDNPEYSLKSKVEYLQTLWNENDIPIELFLNSHYTTDKPIKKLKNNYRTLSSRTDLLQFLNNN
jgi:hypothetical protein